MRFFDYKCQCGNMIENSNDLSPPTCMVCYKLMERVYSPSQIHVRGGTPRFYGNNDRPNPEKPSGAWGEELAEDQRQERNLQKQIVDNDERAKKNYVAGELHHKHGTPDEPNTKKFQEAGHKA